MKTSFIFLSTILTAHFSTMAAQDIKSDIMVDPDTVAIPTYDLEDLVVVGNKPVIQSDGAKLTYNLEEDPSSKGNSLLDALRKVPMISVDGEDNIKINGQGNLKIYVNGKEDQALTANYQKIFKAMPADAIIKVEVINEPGAKYDAEGTAGILNLVTISKNSTDGYYGTIEGNFGKTSSGGSLYGRIKKGKMALSANFDYADMSLFPLHTDNTQDSENLTSSNSRYQTNFMDQYGKWRYLGGGFNMSYDMTDSDLITASASVFNVAIELDKKKSSFSSTVWNAEHQETGYILRTLDANIANTGFTASAAWEHSFNEEGHKTILSYQYNYGYNKTYADMRQKEQSGIFLAFPIEIMDTKGYNNEHTLQMDYVNPFADCNQTIETGAKGIWRRNLAKSSQWNGEDAAHITELTDNRSDLTQIQDIYAGYISYNGKFGNLSTTAGLRYEHTRMGIRYHWGELPDFTNTLNDLVPNAALAYLFSPASNLRLAYQMRISRPSLNQVNPFVQTFMPNFYSMGNPDLDSQKANKITLTYSNFGRIFGGNIGVEYSTIDNAISQYYYVENGIGYQTYANLGHDRQLAFSGFLNYNITKGMQLSVNGRLTRQMFSSPAEGLSNKGWNFSYGANWNYTLASGYKFNIYGGQNTRTYDLQGYNNGYYYYGLGIGKDLLKDRSLNITINANNFLNSTTTFTMVTETDQLKTVFRNRNRQWNVGISVSWSFGSLKSDVKKTTTSISNDDKAESGKGGMGL